MPINLVADMTLEEEQMNSLERIMAIGMSFTGAYIDANIVFDTTNLDSIVNQEVSEVTAESVHRMLSYFLNGDTHQQENEIKAAV